MAWERGLKKGPPERALALLESACPDSPPEALADFSIGRRDAALLKLREWAFGREMTGNATCRKCGQLLEMKLDAASLRQPFNDGAQPLEISLAAHACTLVLRLPNSTDLLACAGFTMAEIPKQLFGRCLISARMQDKEVGIGQLPDKVIEAAAEAMSKADPQANLEMDISCIACGHEWREFFDIVSFFWTEIDAWARRMLREIHVLASAYGWSEAEILNLSPLRRSCYLELIS